MRRKFWLLIVGIVLLVCALASFSACESYKQDAISPVGDANAPVLSNGGLVVKQGNYLYFVNGYTDYLKDSGKDNWFGTPVKGAIVRVTYNADGSLGNDYTIVVPKTVMASSENVGFSIFGEWIYYVSPSADTDRYGTVQTDTLQFLRTKIDGTDTQLILEWDDTSVKYKYTASALVFFDSSDSKLYSKDLTAKKFKASDKGDMIDEKVASVHFIKNETYDPAAKETPVADYVLYTKNSEESYDNTNTLYITDPRGAEKKAVIEGGTAFGTDKYSVSVIASAVENDALVLYYTKTSYVGTSSSGTVVGTYAYRFAAGKAFAFTAANEKELTFSSLSSIYALGYEKGVVSTSSNAVLYKIDGNATAYGDLDLSNLLTIQNDTFYYLKDSKILYYPMNGESNAHYAYTTDEKVMTSFTGAEYFDGYLYFILDDDYDYMARVKIADIDIYSGKDAAVTPVRIVSEADQQKIDEAAAKEESSKD